MINLASPRQDRQASIALQPSNMQNVKTSVAAPADQLAEWSFTLCSALVISHRRAPKSANKLVQITVALVLVDLTSTVSPR